MGSFVAKGFLTPGGHAFQLGVSGHRKAPALVIREVEMAVSYTHLDVYKRQHLYCTKRYGTRDKHVLSISDPLLLFRLLLIVF